MLVAIVLLLVLAPGPAPARAADLDERVPARPGGLLQVDLDMGEDFVADRLSLDVRSHDADEVWLVADLSGLGGSSVSFRVERDERGVRLYGRSGGLLSWLLGGPGVAVRVWVPRDFALDVRCTAGIVRIEDVTGSVRGRVGRGSIEVRGVEGKLWLKSTSGDVRVSEVVGDVDVRVDEGEIGLDWVTGDVEARTGDGDVQLRQVDGSVSVRTDQGEIEALEQRGPIEARTERGAVYARFTSPPSGLLETYGGSVHVVLPEHAGADLDLRTRRGTVQFGPGVRLAASPTPDRYVGAVNGGGAPLRVFSGRGSIRVDLR